MKKSVKEVVRPYIPQIVLNSFHILQEQKRFNNWQKNGKPNPPPHLVKELTVAEYQQKYGYTTLVETGTYLGDMVEAQKKHFKKIISIELGIELSKRAQRRFRNSKNVLIKQGDSGEVLKDVMKELQEPAIFWLDGHYSSGITAKGEKECPVFEELEAIFNNKKLDHILLIDDARCFVGENDYPTIENLTEYVQKKHAAYKVEVKDDIIRYAI
jgi:hypothetical protein